MYSDASPLLVALAASGLVMALIGIILATWRLLIERTRRRLRQRQSRRREGWASSQEPLYGPPTSSESQAESRGPSAKTDADAGKPNTGEPSLPAAIERAHERRAEEPLVAAERHAESLRRESEAEAARITEEARLQARELVEKAELEAKRIVDAADRKLAGLVNELVQEHSSLEETRTRLDSLEAIAKAEQHRAEQLLVTAERQSEALRRESEAEAERITEEARHQVRDLLEEAELEAKRIVDAADQERAGLLSELAQERSILEETRTRLTGFLADALEEVEGTPAASPGPSNVHDLGEALRLRTSSGADH
jgi:cell division septum initiation protein DivIVA